MKYLSSTTDASIRELTADEIAAVAGGDSINTLPVGIFTAVSHVPSPIDSAAQLFPPGPMSTLSNPVFAIYPPSPCLAALFGKPG
jgi:hypothetical protein